MKKYSAKEVEAIKIIRPNQSIMFINSDSFRTEMYSICPLKDSHCDQTLLDSVSSFIFHFNIGNILVNNYKNSVFITMDVVVDPRNHLITI